MNRDLSGAAFDSSPAPRAQQLVTRKGVVTSQLRGEGGRFGGKAQPDIPGFRSAPPTDWDAIEDLRNSYRRRAERRRLLTKIVTVGAVVLCALIVLYFAGQFLR